MECIDKQQTKIVGTKIQATLFNLHIETWNDNLKPNKSYYIAKGRLDRVNPNYYSIDKELKLFFVGFISLDHVDKLLNGTILVSMNPLIEKEYSKRREIVVTNEQREMVKSDNKDFMVTPSKEMRGAIEVPLVCNIDGDLDDSQDCLYKLKETIVDMLNKVHDTAYDLKCVVENGMPELYYLKRQDIYYAAVCFERKCVHRAAEKTGPLKWLIQWDIVDL
ncbi:hypothetical protein H5410_027885 [Solanum commersonii]|uniref:Uncharacterized protein n=1 Tax=Solanum commersonii TaxID=4109 RepID=A0A9J5Z0F3_SOLCO|nr:hypothetical protein H5410_027885 [Solanum commersonii]